MTSSVFSCTEAIASERVCRDVAVGVAVAMVGSVFMVCRGMQLTVEISFNAGPSFIRRVRLCLDRTWRASVINAGHGFASRIVQQ